ncbi:MAG: carboxypeptidase regulatory-like domain-containing protein [Candidatus Acidiferrales bacterium]
MSKRLGSYSILALVLVFSAAAARGQSGSSGSVEGVVKDPSGSAVADAKVEMSHSVSGFHREAITGADGGFKFTNVPFNPYHLVVTAAQFESYTQDVDVRSTVPVTLQIELKIGAASMSVTVTENGGDLIETQSTFHTDVDRALFDTLPLESVSSSVSSLVTLTSPGVAADSNGLFHGLGDHASNSFSVDGQPITDQQSKVFSNQIPSDSIQSMEVISGAPPAEFGGKTSLVIVVTTRSGMGVHPAHGQVTASYGSFGTVNGGFDLAYGGNNWGNYISANGLNTARFLDGPEIGVMHDRGNEENLFDRVDYKASSADTISINLGYSRSWFQTPNSYDAQNGTGWTFNSADPTCPAGQTASCGGLGPNGLPVGPQDQRSKIGTFNIAPSWTRLVNTNTVFTLGGFVRQDQYNYYPSGNPFADQTPDLQLETIRQHRTLTNAGVRASLSYVKGMNNVKMGVTYEHTFLTENDKFGIVNPVVNAVCLNADGSLDTNPTITDPATCGGANNSGGSLNPTFTPLLGCYDLTRTAPLPLSDGCPTGQTNSGMFPFNGHTDIKETALYAQDAITIKDWSLNLGLRADLYNGIATAKQLEPRVGIAYKIKPTSTVLRLSYARTMETPFNENLILASTGCNNPVIFDLQQSVPGGQCVSSTVPPLSPGHRNEFHAGLEQAFKKYLVVDAEYIWKYTHEAFDFSVLGNTPITYPIEWASSKIPGYAIRASVPDFHGFTAFVVMSSVAARFFTPQVSGIGATPGGSHVFRIDHDEKFNQTTHLQYQPWKRGPWVGFNWRYDSGGVAGPVPCFGGQACANGPGGGGPNELIDVSGLTPDQQFQAGLFCGSVFATPTTPISSTSGTNLCPASIYGSKYVTVPAPGTENNDHNPPRVAPRNLFDVTVGEDDLFHGDRYKWSLRLTAINVTNKVALYNFLSTFSGTHYVTPRALTAELGFHF